MTAVLFVFGLIFLAHWMLSKETFELRFKRSRQVPFRSPGRKAGRAVDKGEMLRCHNCGCFFPESRIVTKVIEGHIIEFCSTNCRENFRYP